MFGRGGIEKTMLVHVDIESEHGWMDDLQFYVLFNSISVISGR